MDILKKDTKEVKKVENTKTEVKPQPKELTKEDILIMFPSGMKNAVEALIKYLKK